MREHTISSGIDDRNFLGSDVLNFGRIVTDVSEDRAAFTSSKKAWTSPKMEEAV